MEKKLARLRLLDAKVYLNRNEGLRSSSSMTVNNHPKISSLQNSLGIGDANGDLHVYPATHSRNDVQDLPTVKMDHSPFKLNLHFCKKIKIFHHS